MALVELGSVLSETKGPGTNPGDSAVGLTD